MSEQQQLPFGVAEGAYTERKALLWVALQQVNADWHLVRLCEWVFEQTSGGIGSPVRASYEYLANGPWMLQCGVSTARRKVAVAKEQELLLVEGVFEADGRQAKAFQIDWNGIRSLLSIASNHPCVNAQIEHVDAQIEQPRAQIEQPRAQIEHPGAHSEHHSEHHTGPLPADLIPVGETPRGRAGAPSFVPSLRPTTTSERTDVSWREISSLGREAKRLLYPGSASQIAHGDRKHWTIARLAYLALVKYGREWLLDGIQTAGKRKPRDLSYAKGVLANLSGNRAEFFTQFDSLQSDAPWYQPGRSEADDG